MKRKRNRASRRHNHINYACDSGWQFADFYGKIRSLLQVVVMPRFTSAQHCLSR